MDSEAYMLVTNSSHHQNYEDYVEVNSGRSYDLNVYLQAALRRQYPELALTVTLTSNVSLLPFAFAGYATATLDIVDESVLRTRYFITPSSVAESRTFAKYLYKWGDEYFIVYIVQLSYYQTFQYIFKEPAKGETIMSGNGKTDELIKAVGQWQIPPPPGDKWVYVYDGYWFRSKALYEQVKNASWDDVILNEEMKKQITGLMHKFFDSRDIYKNLGVPWKRGVIFHGPAGNGKTISIKALMNSLFKSDGLSIPSLYVKSATSTYSIRNIFQQARYMSPCLLIFEDIDTIVTKSTRSYFFNEVDGLENNDGIFMVASTNHLDQLDAGLSSRPSRFDRKYLFPLPSEEERNLYCQYWRERLKKKKVEIEFPKRICPAVALITDGFSFAYMQEAFVATLLAIAQERSELDDIEEVNTAEDVKDDKDLDSYELWRELKKTIKALRNDMDNTPDKDKSSNKEDDLLQAFALEKEAQAPTSEPNSLVSQSTIPLRLANRSSKGQTETAHVRESEVYVDYQGAPIITEENTLLYSLDQVTA
ncbi:MAG: hypothetical protein HETSPECPRED_007326 [Heterodermia speciosa]|uniref:AAA+ ATPase domain-containing protein n=1 Tax=Heterodermia speciosa TaxID=116794 RepID=A0A8H3FR65_9LECA|nr:MAG: hypothetical protein HETSPECPRED_007326 [Heterodermia speciosa]